MPCVVIFQRRLPAYRVALFSKLREQLAHRGVKLKVVYGPPEKNERIRNDTGNLSWGIEVPTHYLHFGKTWAVWHKLPRDLFLSADLVILPQENRVLANYPVFLARRRKRRPVAYWGHGANFQRNPESLNERIKAWLSVQVDWWFAYTSLSAVRVSATGLPTDRITCLNNAVDVEQLALWREGIRAVDREQLLAKLGFSGRCVGIFLGSLTEEKRLGFLFAAADGIRKKIDDFELLLIGDGVERDFVRSEVARRPWCRWVGARQREEKVLHLSLGKLLLNPGMVGLGVLDSFAMGLPMVTTDCGLHSPEIAYLVHDRNGLMTENRIEAFVAAVVGLLNSEDRRATMAEGCRADVHRYTLDNMVAAYVDGICKALDLRRDGKTAPVRHLAVI